MKENNTTKNNKIIAKFMGLKAEFVEYDREFNNPIYVVYSNTHLFFRNFKVNDVSLKQGFDKENPLEYFYKFLKFKYHSSWDWLMPVVEKIESSKREEDEFDIFGNCVQVGDNEFVGKTKIEAVYMAVVEFIKKKEYYHFSNGR